LMPELSVSWRWWRAIRYGGGPMIPPLPSVLMNEIRLFFHGYTCYCFLCVVIVFCREIPLRCYDWSSLNFMVMNCSQMELCLYICCIKRNQGFLCFNMKFEDTNGNGSNHSLLNR
jgi:hypothetical protein